ncbi:cyanophycinase [Foetidibacter luteolus]|uniref:cyanophycinase n=1 Tax=Foetidibacter luteolus TaxID=2608880 RepID=UPI00129BB3F0|nr:cyanophycinase [Foetidibacter luteolus]
MHLRLSILQLLLIFSVASNAQQPAGKLFIIGGGNRTEALMKTMIHTAGLNSNDYIVVLPMSSSEPDTSFYYIYQDIRMVCRNPVANLNFTTEKVSNQQWLDSLEHAKLIFITGGDQSRFMKAVLNTPVFAAIHKAYNSGATVAGTSAGAAVMSEHMITGNELRGDTTYHSTFGRIWNGNIEFTEGLGLLKKAVIDQHFIARSRYNRLISALAAFPQLACIGIDEATAIIVHKDKATVAGNSQVVVFKKPQGLTEDPKGLIKWKDILFSIYTDGDSFELD